jgi:hypothetical protein
MVLAMRVRRDTDHDEAVRRVMSSVGIPGTVICADLLDVEARLVLQLDEAEHLRRSAAGLAAVTDRSVLRLLCTLPWGYEVAWRDLPRADWARLRSLPSGVVAASRAGVTRLLMPPLALACGVIVDDDWRRGLDHASVFAPFAPRILLMPITPPNTEELALEAALFGVGVAVAEDVSFLVDPADHPGRPLGPVAWRVRETAYEALLTSVA